MKHKILLVDDEEKMIKYLSRHLIKKGFDVSTACSGIAALEKVREQDFAVVLLDVLMPGMDGIETLREIKKIKPLTEVIMVTGHASVEVGIEGMKLGAFDYVIKPFDLTELVTKIHKAYDQRIYHEKGIEAVDIPEMPSKKPS
ncbi:MAG: response regulator [Thermodesulfobacteriota bacterium]|nr:response regulator [Thermodesulfobacteriota bacterium]